MRIQDEREQKIYRVLRDCLVAGGFLAIVAGCWCAWPPAGLIMAGFSMATLGIGGHLDMERRRGEEERNRRMGL